jgi:hypothetical protein
MSEKSPIENFRIVLRSLCGSTYWYSDEHLNGDLTVYLDMMAAGRASLEVRHGPWISMIDSQ